jgi:ribosomal protein S18 acetylase RimI-like enzyme
VRIRAAKARDLDALVELEGRVFATDRLSRRSLRRFLSSASAAFMVAEGKDLAAKDSAAKDSAGKGLAGTAIVLFRPGSAVARLYSIAVAPHMSGKGVASLLLKAVERVARRRGCTTIRLEVHETNHAAITRYRKQGYQEFGRHRRYYDDGGDALRFHKIL